MKKIIVAVAALALMAGSAYAADWNFYGEAQVWTGWSDMDPVEGDDDGNAYDTQYGENLYTDSSIGANVKVSDELSARFEYQLDGSNVRLEHLYGAWNFGAGILTVGQTDTPINVAYSNQLVPDDGNEELGLGGFGDFDNGQNAEIMLTFGGFSIAIISPERDNNTFLENEGLADSDLWNDDFDLDGYDIDRSTQAVIPMIAVCYKTIFDMGEVQIAGGYNRVEVRYDTDFGSYEEDIDSYAVALGGNLNFGAFGMFATAVWGQNIANLGASTASQFGGQALVALGVEDGEAWAGMADCESIGGTIGVTFAVNEMLALEAGYGYIHDEFDEDDLEITDMAQSYYLQAAITLAPGVTVTPEVGMIDERESGQDEILYFGAAWAIAF